ncbi:hypothetical protein N9Y42_08335 [Mariniblastus sp.]|nr:hypothetical protein [Mariniblastus sp.]
MFKIPARESAVVWRLFAYSLTIATSYFVARTVGDSLFLSRIGNDQLALTFVIAGCCTAVIAGAWYFATRHISVSKSIQISGVAFALLSLAAWALLPSYHHSYKLLAAIYLLAEVKGVINTINVVSVLNTKLGRDASKPAWAAIGVAAPLAAVVAGGFFSLEHGLLSLRYWLLFGAVLDVASCLIGFVMAKTPAIGKTIDGEPKPRTSSLSHLREDSGSFKLAQKVKKVYVSSSKFRFWIGVLFAAKVIALTIVAFEWKSSVNLFYKGDEVQMLRFFGIYYGAVGLATIGLQLFLTSSLLVQRNIALPILLMPVLLLGVAFSFVAGASLIVVFSAATFGKSLDAWRRSVHDTTLNLLYTKIKRKERRGTISLSSGVIKPLSEVVASSVILFGAAAIYRPLFFLALLIWILSAAQLIRLVGKTHPTPAKTAGPKEETVDVSDSGMVLE